jgi:hypothetical protein
MKSVNYLLQDIESTYEIDRVNESAESAYEFDILQNMAELEDIKDI